MDKVRLLQTQRIQLNLRVNLWKKTDKHQFIQKEMKNTTFLRIDPHGKAKAYTTTNA